MRAAAPLPTNRSTRSGRNLPETGPAETMGADPPVKVWGRRTLFVDDTAMVGKGRRSRSWVGSNCRVTGSARQMLDRNRKSHPGRRSRSRLHRTSFWRMRPYIGFTAILFGALTVVHARRAVVEPSARGPWF